jgi:hypothetical protein
MGDQGQLTVTRRQSKTIWGDPKAILVTLRKLPEALSEGTAKSPGVSGGNRGQRRDILSEDTLGATTTTKCHQV